MTLYRIFRDERGFTLIELVIILILIGLLAGIAIPRYVNLTEQARNAASRATLDSARAALALDFASDVAANQSYTIVLTGNITATLEDLMENTPRYPAGFSWVRVADGTDTSPGRVSAILNGVDVNTL
ncbi:MAG: prepilin-type N-terminal cleavage/methylation domain-containing protein [Candidatus Methylomirabilales bacterium]